MPLRLYNTLTRRLEPFVPADPSRVTFYTCGPTVYDDAHIGNFRSFLAADVLRRWIESPLCELATDAADPDNPAKVHKGPRQVVHVMNITDVGHMTDDAAGGESGEDRMAVAGRRLAEAKKAGTLPPGVDVNPSDPYQIARFYEARFREDAVKLGLKVAMDAAGDPTLMPRATESVPGMIAVIGRLAERGFAYVAGPIGGRAVYFDVQKFKAYGSLSGNTLERLRSGAGGRVSGVNQSQKRHPADFLLWKEDPRHVMKWPSPWGEGYPGWHIECTAMAASRLCRSALRADNGQSRLGEPTYTEPLIDLHSGGEDNIFPHHECEIAQSCCAFNADPASVTPQRGMYARMWFHPRFLLVEGDKMSKSKGNFYTPRDLFEKGIEPAAIRLELIRTHYRSNANFTFQGLADSQRMVERWRRVQAEPSGMGDAAAESRVLRDFAAAMSDDLNVSAAIAAVNSWASGVTTPGAAEQRAIQQFDAILGVLGLERPRSAETAIGVFGPGVPRDAAVETKLIARRDARAAKDFKKSDAIRDELAAMGYAIKDLPGGKVEVRRA
ncbi:MAG: cysteine--tRNA ligase [Phycisphaerales bacterium]|nr:cysteine--tRNA ligase [Phycisphaerales bacterium]